MSSNEIAIHVRNVSKHYAVFGRPEDRLKQMVQPRIAQLLGLARRQYYRDFAALSDISFEVRRGETVGIIGRNGCGKSTLLQIICGTLQPTAGTAEVNGRIAALLELGTGFNPEFTGRENAFLNAAILGMSQAEIDERFDDIARFADIGLFIEQPVKTYSSGMYVRLAFAVAINVDPDILVVDEALAVGDEAFQRKCFARIEDIKDKGGTILFVSHGAQTIVQLCDWAMLLDRGEKILDGRPKTVVNQYQRFLNLSGADAESMREEIKAMDGWADTKAGVADADGGADDVRHGDETRRSAQSGPSKLEAGVPESDGSWYDPHLVSQSSIKYEVSGAQIGEVRIETLDGRRVNNLVHGNVYQYCYDVDFYVDFVGVEFAMLTKTVTGLEIAGQLALPAGSGFDVAAGQRYNVLFPFKVDFLPGTYYCNAGVYTNRGGFRQFHRIIDALAFRVMADIRINRHMGIVSILPRGAKASVTLTTDRCEYA